MAKYVKKSDRKFFDLDSMIDGIKNTAIGESTDTQGSYIPDIMEFCYSTRYLNLKNKGMQLYPVQEIILKCFYRGQPGNTNVELTDKEIELLKKERCENILEKYYSGELFRELILVLGRRSGKDFMCSLIALYETMRLMEIPGGDPLTFYGIGDGQPIYVLTIATAAEQAEILFREIKAKMHTSPYFRNKLGHLESREMWFMTPADRIKKQELLDAGLKQAADDIKGSVVIMAGHSNSDSLLGKRYFCCAGNSLVLTSNGLQEISSLHNLSNKNLKITGIEGESIADKWFDNGVRDTLNIKTDSGNFIEVTPDHQLLVWDSELNDVSFRFAKEIKHGDFLIGQYGQKLFGNNTDINFNWEYNPKKYGEKISCPICTRLMEQINSQHIKSHGMSCSEFKLKYPAYPTRSDAAIRKFNSVDTHANVPKKLTFDLARLLGYIIGEGNSTHPASTSLCNTDSDIANDMKYCADKTFDSTSITQCLPREASHKEYSKILINGRKSFDFLHFIGVNRVKAPFKEIPWIILSSPQEYVCQFLRAYFDAECTVDKKENRIYINATALKLLRQVQMLLLNLGILTTFRTLQKPKKKHHHQQYSIKITCNSIEKFVKLVGFTSRQKMNDALEIVAKHKEIAKKPNLFGIPVNDHIRNINKKYSHLFPKDIKRKYGFYGFSNQNTVSLNSIEQWNQIYQSLFIHDPVISKICELKLYGDMVESIEKSSNHVYDIHVKSKYHSYTCNSLINHNCLMFDEVAAYKASSAAQSGERLYAALGPGQSDFNQVVGHDREGNEIRRMDSKMISISSPRGEEGIFYKMYKETPFTENRLAFRFPTWKVNLRIPEEMVRKENKYMTESEFRMEFGAEFSGTSGERFISDYYVEKAFEAGELIGEEKTGFRGMGYYCHLDPATRSHNYALAVVHVEERMLEGRTDQGFVKREKKKYFIVDHIKFWTPTMTKEVDINEVDQYIIDLSKKFKFVMVTYDSWNSASSQQKLRRQGIPCKETPYRAKYKMAIYERLHNLLITETLILPKKSPAALLTELELKNLKKVYTPKGFKIQPNPEGDVKTDDITDAIAGACGIATDYTYTGYPKMLNAKVPQFKNNPRSWQIGGGTYTDRQWTWMHRKFGY